MAGNNNNNKKPRRMSIAICLKWTLPTRSLVQWHFQSVVMRLSWSSVFLFLFYSIKKWLWAGVVFCASNQFWYIHRSYYRLFYSPYCVVRIISRFRIGSLVGKTSNSSITTELTFLLESADSALTALIIFPWSAKKGNKWEFQVRFIVSNGENDLCDMRPKNKADIEITSRQHFIPCSWSR